MVDTDLRLGDVARDALGVAPTEVAVSVYMTLPSEDMISDVFYSKNLKVTNLEQQFIKLTSIKSRTLEQFPFKGYNQYSSYGTIYYLNR